MFCCSFVSVFVEFFLYPFPIVVHESRFPWVIVREPRYSTLLYGKSWWWSSWSSYTRTSGVTGLWSLSGFQTVVSLFVKDHKAYTSITSACITSE